MRKNGFFKMGAADCFFLGDPCFYFLFNGRRAHLAHISFFLILKRPLLFKTIMGNLNWPKALGLLGVRVRGRGGEG